MPPPQDGQKEVWDSGIMAGVMGAVAFSLKSAPHKDMRLCVEPSPYMNDGVRRCLAMTAWPGLLLASAGLSVAAPVATPYAADATTLHLWHFNEPTPPFRDSGTSPTSLLGLLNGAQAGAPALAQFGSSVRFVYDPANESGRERPYGPILLAKPLLDIGDADNVDAPFPVTGDDGAFTMEALVKLDALPSASPGYAADIITMDDDIAAHRVFLFRIEKPGFLSFVPLFGDAVRGGGLATIPTSGAHAINTHDWFHVAVTYDGNENVSNNLRLFWTRLGSGAESANQIGSGTLSADLRLELGDFAIGNSGKFNNLGPFEFFPGYIDEVRISGIARRAHDFCFVSPEAKARAAACLSPGHSQETRAELTLRQVWVDEAAVPPRPDLSPLVIGPGMHRLDFDFGFPTGVHADPLGVKCRLDGLDEDWKPAASGMTLTWEMLDMDDKLLARTVFATTRSSPGWGSDVLDSRLTQRTEPLFIPENTRRIRVVMSSGSADTTGCWVIDDLALTRSAAPEMNLWANGGFDKGERIDQIGGIPAGWSRGGTEPAIARVMQGRTPELCLLDARQDDSAFWTCTQDLTVFPTPGGETFRLAWREAYNVISGALLRATFMNVSSGKYTFRAIAVTNSPVTCTSQLAVPFVIRQPFWKQVWFLPVLAAAGVIFIGWGLFRQYRRRARARIAAIKQADAMERDRARIARDMHDDLGTRVSLMKHVASVVREAIEHDPGQASRQALRLESAASDLVRAMDGLVWAVNPANDTLEHLAGHLSSVAQEIFRDAPVRLRISIPTDLPVLLLSSDFRHHFSLAVKEVLHNILKHAGLCEATLQLTAEGGSLIAIITDTGTGFDPAHPQAGNGLPNLIARAGEINGTCEIQAAPGKGTRVVLRCPLPIVAIE